MSDELFPVNTPETLGVMPRYVLQHNAISRSAHNFSATAKKLTAMAMALLPTDLSSLSVAFTFPEFCDALDVPTGGKSFSLFKEAVIECMESKIEIEKPPDKKGKTNWVIHHWFQLAEFNKYTGICTMIFDQKLAVFLKEFKWLYSRINLNDMGKLKSRYALRIYEIAISYSSLQGKNGNDSQAWYFERNLEELRKLFGIAPGEYPENWEFRRRVIEDPVREINDAGIGVQIRPQSIKKGRVIMGFRFECESAAKTAKKKRVKQGEPPAKLPEPNPRTAGDRLEKEKERLKERYPEEFAAFYEEGKAKAPEWVSEKLRLASAGEYAAEKLKAKHGIVK
jgi:plasmid replication initiation protein